MFSPSHKTGKIYTAIQTKDDGIINSEDEFTQDVLRGQPLEVDIGGMWVDAIPFMEEFMKKLKKAYQSNKFRVKE